MSDSFDTWDGPRSVPPTSGRAAHTNPEDDPALLRSELTACRREIERLRSELAEARDALLRRDEPCCDDRRIYDGGAYFKPYCVNCGRPA